MRTLGILLLTLLCTTARAQIGEKKDPAFDPPAWAMIDDSLGHVLGLTNEQMKLVQQADEHYRANVKAGDQGAMEARDKDLRAVLLPSQFEQWKEIAGKLKSSKR
jgi:hypothetical protein